MITRFKTALILALLAVACGPYVVPRLPVSHDGSIRFDVIPIRGDTRKDWVTPKPPAPLIASTEGRLPDADYDYIVGPGDFLRLIIYTFDATGEQSAIRVFPEGLPLQGEDEFLVEADGTILFPYVGRITVGNKPFRQVEKLIERGLRKYFVQPQFQVRVSQFGHSRAMVTGEVAQPGEVFLSHRPLTVLNAISEAGGLLPTADLSAATLTRADGRSEPLNLTALYFEGDARANKTLRTGDQLTLPRGHANQIFITGEVLAPQTVAMHPVGFSLPEALQQVGWITPETGDPSDIYILRAAANPVPGEPDVTIYHLDASNLAQFALAEHFMMRPRDIIYVSMQPITSWNRLINQFLPGGLATVIGPNPIVGPKGTR